MLTAHVVLPADCFRDGHALEILHDVRECAAEHFEVGHTTFQLESPHFHDSEHDATVCQPSVVGSWP